MTGLQKAKHGTNHNSFVNLSPQEEFKKIKLKIPPQLQNQF